MEMNKRARKSVIEAGSSGLLTENASLDSIETVSILDLPIEVLVIIFEPFSYMEIARDFRPVCRRFRHAASSALNSGLVSLGGRMQRAARVLALHMQAAEQAELRLVSKAFNLTEVLQQQHRLLLAVMWRSLDPAEGRCMYAGSLLDHLVELVRAAELHPDRAAASAQPAVTDRLCDRLRRFMDHFEKNVELRTEPAWLPGAKLLDLMDIGVAVQREASFEVTSAASSAWPQKLVRLRARYTVPRTYFVALPLASHSASASQGTDARKEERRLMFMRLRRLVQHSNEHAIHRIHLEREAALSESSAPPQAASISFTGYGESRGHFFFYGALNEKALESRTTSPPRAQNGLNPPAAQAGQEREDRNLDTFMAMWYTRTVGFMNARQNDVHQEHGEHSADAVHGSTSSDAFSASEIPEPSSSASPIKATSATNELHVLIDVDLQCPLELAPFALQEDWGGSRSADSADSLCAKCSRSGADAPPDSCFHLSLSIQCPMAAEGRLPTRYLYQECF